MKLQTNIVLDTVNANGRLYQKDTFQNAFNKYIEGNKGLIYTDSSSVVRGDLMRAIGKVKSYEIINNIVEIEGNFLNTPEGKMYEEFYKSGNISITSAGFGKVKNGEVTDFILKGFHIIKRENNMEIKRIIMTIDTTQFMEDETQIIIDKIEALSIAYRRNTDDILILDKIDQKTFHYLIDFSK